MGRAPGSRAHPLPVPVAGSSLLACSGASVSIVHFKSDPGMSKARCLLARYYTRVLRRASPPPVFAVPSCNSFLTGVFISESQTHTPFTYQANISLIYQPVPDMTYQSNISG